MSSNPATIGVFFIHGFLGSPLEWSSIETLLRKKGYGTGNTFQLGHDTEAEMKLIDCKAEAILEHCMNDYMDFSKQFDRVYIVGHSLGGLAALWIAGQKPEKLEGVLAFSTPHQHAYWVNHFFGLIQFPIKNIIRGLFYAQDYFTGYKKPDFYFTWMKTLQFETTRVFSEVDSQLPHIEVPVWLAHSPYDLAVPYTEMERIAKGINKPELVKTHTLSRCGHQVFQTRRIYDEPDNLVFQFLEQLIKN